MNEFLLIFRRDYQTSSRQPPLEQLEDHLARWQSWFSELASSDKLARQLQRWDGQGRIITKDRIVSPGPYVELKESVGGLLIIKADDYAEAVEIARACPIFELGGNVEIRMGGLNRI
ncbi:YciI family protein [Pedobacter miscanthi]|uniref:Transcription initiation protein n=1 Tax=Pedobacter miscanthi TaxID=2259170 RepID=A0A366L0D6_9SPHI|nr:YciI family protein [Pedobacter miscanthi]RBQ06764.1 transcription initiation protein [Pedobacter miscanthi]